MADGNGTPVERRELTDKIELVRAEQRTEHTKTRALVLAVGLPGLVKSFALLGLIHLPF